LPRLIRRCARATAIPPSPLSVNSMLQPDIVLVRLASGGETNRRINEAAKLSKRFQVTCICARRLLFEDRLNRQDSAACG
jgi:hypothetical protein